MLVLDKNFTDNVRMFISIEFHGSVRGYITIER